PPMQLIERGGGTKSARPILCPASLCQTTSCKYDCSSTSEAPPRRRERRSCSSMLKRQVRILPSAVNRNRLQCPQNGSLTGAMIPTSADEPTRQRRAVSDLFDEITGSR